MKHSYLGVYLSVNYDRKYVGKLAFEVSSHQGSHKAQDALREARLKPTEDTATAIINR